MAILEPQDEGGFTVQCLELPGAISQGETKEEALENIKAEIGLVLEVLNYYLVDRSNADNPESGTGRCLLPVISGERLIMIFV